MSNRYVWGTRIDVLLADEQVGGETYWPALDHLNTIRDLVDAAGNVANHISYDAYGRVTAESDQANKTIFRFTG